MGDGAPSSESSLLRTWPVQTRALNLVPCLPCGASRDDIPFPYHIATKQRKDTVLALAYLLLLGMVFLWAGNFPTSKFVLDDIGPLTLITLRTLVGAIVLTALGWKSTPNWWAALREDPKSTVFLAFTGVVASGMLFYLGLRITTASNAGILAAATPIWVTLLSWVFLKERLGAVNVAGVVLSFSGLVTILCQGSWANLLNRSFNWGDILIMIGQLSWAAYTVYGRIVLARRSPTATTASAYLAGSVMLLPVCFLESPFSVSYEFSPLALAAIGYLCLLSPFTNLLYYYALTRVSPHRAAVFMNLIPIIVMVFSAVFLGEQITQVQIVGTGMVIGGVVLTTRF